MGGPTLLRDRRVRVADDITDAQTPAQIELAIPSSVTEEDYQVYFLSRLREVIYGNDPSHHWYDNFEGNGTLPLTALYEHELLDNEPVAVGTTYAVSRVGSKVSQETWTNTATTIAIKTIAYAYTGNKVAQEVRTLFAPDGVTIVAQVTFNYSYAGSVVTGGTIVRNV